MILLYFWKFSPLLLLPSLINGNEVYESETNINRAVYLTLLQMLQNTIFDKYKEGTVEQPPSANMAVLNDLQNKIKFASTTSLSNTKDNTIGNFFKLVRSITAPQTVSNLPSLSSSTLVPIVYANGQIGMTPLEESTMQHPSNLNSAAYSTLPINQMNTGLNAYPLPISNFNNNFATQLSGSIGNGPLSINYGAYGNIIKPNLYKGFENEFGGSDKFETYQPVASASEFNPNYSGLPNDFLQYGQPLWNSRGPRHILHLPTSSDPNKFTRSTMKHIFPINSGKNFKIMKKPLTRYAPYQSSKYKLKNKIKLRINH